MLVIVTYVLVMRVTGSCGTTCHKLYYNVLHDESIGKEFAMCLLIFPAKEPWRTCRKQDQESYNAHFLQKVVATAVIMAEVWMLPVTE